jgi:hypothetical protein
MMSSLMIWIAAILFGLSETAYFGWNWSPKSDAEMVCDGITMILAALALLSLK